MKHSNRGAVGAFRSRRRWVVGVVALLAVILIGGDRAQEAEARSRLIGKAAPELLLAGGVNGVDAKTKLKQFLGKPVLLVFFNPGCRRCKSMMPIVDNMTRRYEKKGLVSIGVTTKASAEIKRYLVEKHYTFSVGIDSGRGATMGRYGIRLFPTIFIIGVDGRVKPLVGGKYFLTIEHELEAMKKAEEEKDGDAKDSDPKDSDAKDSDAQDSEENEKPSPDKQQPKGDAKADATSEEDDTPPTSGDAGNKKAPADEPKKPDPTRGPGTRPAVPAR